MRIGLDSGPPHNERHADTSFTDMVLVASLRINLVVTTFVDSSLSASQSLIIRENDDEVRSAASLIGVNVNALRNATAFLLIMLTNSRCVASVKTTTS